jgi:hypothetical protein
VTVARRLTVAGALALTGTAGLLVVILAPSFPTHEGFRIALAAVFVFGVPLAGMAIARRLVPDQRSNAPGYLVLFVTLLFAAFDPATEGMPPLAVAAGLCSGIFVAAFVGTYWRQT